MKHSDTQATQHTLFSILALTLSLKMSLPSSQCHKKNQRNGRDIDFSNRLLDLFEVCLVTDSFPLGVPENQTSNTDVSVLHASLRNSYLRVYLVLKTVSSKLLAFPKKLLITESDYSQLQLQPQLNHSAYWIFYFECSKNLEIILLKNPSEKLTEMKCKKKETVAFLSQRTVRTCLEDYLKKNSKTKL